MILFGIMYLYVISHTLRPLILFQQIFVVRLTLTVIYNYLFSHKTLFHVKNISFFL